MQIWGVRFYLWSKDLVKDGIKWNITAQQQISHSISDQYTVTNCTPKEECEDRVLLSSLPPRYIRFGNRYRYDKFINHMRAHNKAGPNCLFYRPSHNTSHFAFFFFLQTMSTSIVKQNMRTHLGVMRCMGPSLFVSICIWTALDTSIHRNLCT